MYVNKNMALHKHLKYGLQSGVSVSLYICTDFEYHLGFLLLSINILNPEQNGRYFQMQQIDENFLIFIQIFTHYSDWH